MEHSRHPGEAGRISRKMATVCALGIRIPQDIRLRIFLPQNATVERASKYDRESYAIRAFAIPCAAAGSRSAALIWYLTRDDSDAARLDSGDARDRSAGSG